MNSIADELAKLLQLKENGTLSQQEFDVLKRRLIEQKGLSTGQTESRASLISLMKSGESLIVFGITGGLPDSNSQPEVYKRLTSSKRHAWWRHCPACGYKGRVCLLDKEVLSWYGRPYMLFWLYGIIMMPGILLADFFLGVNIMAGPSTREGDLAFQIIVLVTVFILWRLRRKAVWLTMRCPSCEQEFSNW